MFIQIVFAAVVVAMLALMSVGSTQLTTQTKRYGDSLSTVHQLQLAKDLLIVYSKDVDSDGFNEVLAPDGEHLPALIQARLVQALGEAYSPNVNYCAYDLGNTNGVDMAYVSNNPAYAGTHVMAKIISPGPNGVFETTCADDVAKADDVMLTISHEEIRATPREIGGFADTGGSITPVFATDNVNWSKSLVTVGNFASLPNADLEGNPIKLGTIMYYNDGAETALAYYSVSGWKKNKLK